MLTKKSRAKRKSDISRLDPISISIARGGKWHGRTIKYMLEGPLCKKTVCYKGNKVKNKELTLV
jgi:hypothetical protein